MLLLCRVVPPARMWTPFCLSVPCWRMWRLLLALLLLLQASSSLAALQCSQPLSQ